jgi:acetyl esterase/lipase
MMKLSFVIWILSFLLFANSMYAQQRTDLYPASTDKAQGYFLTFKANEGKDAPVAVIICPGGGYSHVAMNHEGIEAAKWLNAQGMDAYVLRYRVTTKEYVYRYPSPLDDVRATYRQIKKKHKSMGVMGFSAGGHLAGLAATDKKQKFAFGILIYPVITSDSAYWHRGSFKALLGEDKYRTSLASSVSIEKRIDKKTPPLFLLHCKDDRVVPYQNSILAQEASIQFTKKTVMHIYEKGSHGFGMRPLNTDAAAWLEKLQQWLMQFNTL